MSQAAPPIVQLAERVLVELEQVVRLFPRYHKYAVGADLREQARIVARRRVVAHCREKLNGWQRRHVRGRRLIGRPADFEAVRSVWQSYLGHLSHANSKRLIGRLHREFPWLRRATARTTFDYRLEGRTVVLLASSQP
jgi:hypothetical protein